MLHLPEVSLRRLRLLMSYSKWLVKLLRLPFYEQDAHKPGVILIQIDSLSREHLETAFKAGRMPFLKNLLDKQRYKLHTHYSGMPSSTPGVQGELFYGVRGCVPSFSFYSRAHNRTITLFNPGDTREFQQRLEKEGVPLFRGGSCYSNVFTGGASESHFCIADLGFSNIFKRRRVVSFVFLILFNLVGLLRAASLLVMEIILVVLDFFKGLFSGRDLWREIKFIPSRVGMCVLLREIIVMGAKMDIARSLPIIQLNLMGYHEQSILRGGSSRFAIWGLRGIDRALKRLWLASKRAGKEYEFWVYSDHGQADAVPYSDKYGETISRTVNDTLNSTSAPAKTNTRHKTPGFTNRLGWRIGKLLKKLGEETAADEKIIVTHLGPYAQVYLDRRNRADKKAAAKKLIQTGRIPAVLIPEKDGVTILTAEAEYKLPDNMDFFKNQFVPEDFPEDIIRACRHPDAGDLIVSGYSSPDEPVLSFTNEYGSHGGISELEYCGFFLASEGAAVHPRKGCVRPNDIRNAVLTVLGRKSAQQPLQPNAADKGDFKIMTYNVHSCVGMDGKLSPLRVAKVIEQFSPDVVALQELDVAKKRTLHKDQARVIADILRMDYFFSPAINIEKEQYGDAVLSRFPMRLVKSGIIDDPRQSPISEPRGALWVEVDINGTKVHIINTHLGLTPQQRQRQLDTLLGEKWLASPDCSLRCILCGDMNFSPRSKLWQRCGEILNQASPDRSPAGTYCGRYPFIQFDHIFYGSALEIVHCSIADTDWARIASDHRPLNAEIKITD